MKISKNRLCPRKAIGVFRQTQPDSYPGFILAALERQTNPGYLLSLMPSKLELATNINAAFSIFTI